MLPINVFEVRRATRTFVTRGKTIRIRKGKLLVGELYITLSGLKRVKIFVGVDKYSGWVNLFWFELVTVQLLPLESIAYINRELSASEQ